MAAPTAAAAAASAQRVRVYRRLTQHTGPLRFSPNTQTFIALVGAVAVTFFAMASVYMYARFTAPAPSKPRPAFPPPPAMQRAGEQPEQPPLSTEQRLSEALHAPPTAVEELETYGWTEARHKQLTKAAAQDMKYATPLLPPAPTATATATGASDDVCAAHPTALMCHSLHLVVCKYRESIAWLHTHATLHSTPRTVYDHYNPLSPFYLAPNFGHEAHGYLRFIVDHYHSLPAVAVFVQANPFDHNPRLIEYIHLLQRSPDLPYTPLQVLGGGGADADAAYVRSDQIDHNRFDAEYERWHKQFPASAVQPFVAGHTAVSAYDRALFAVGRNVIRKNPIGTFAHCLFGCFSCYCVFFFCFCFCLFVFGCFLVLISLFVLFVCGVWCVQSCTNRC